MRRKAVSSSTLASVGYQADTRTLEIEFHSGGVYQYFDVQARAHRELMAATSKGQYFHRHIKDRYRFERVG